MGGLFYTGQSRRTSGSFTVTCSGAEDIVKRLNKLENGGQTAIKKTVNDFMSRAPAWVSKGIREHYGVDTAAINEAKQQPRRGQSSIQVAGVQVDSASLIYKGRTLTPTHFKMSPKSRPSAQQKKPIRIPGQLIAGAGDVAMVRPPRPYQVKATIIKGSRVSLGSNVFLTGGNGGSMLPFQKTGRGRSPIEAVRTLSVPQMIDGKARQTIETAISEKLGERFKDSRESNYKAVPSYYESNKIARVATGTGPISWSHDKTMAGIWDMNGNVWEWQGGIRLVWGELQILANNDAADPDNPQNATSTCWKAINAADGALVDPESKTTDSSAHVSGKTVKLDYVNNKWTYSTSITNAKDESRSCAFYQVTADSSIGDAAKVMLRALALLPDSDVTTDVYEGDYMWWNNGVAERCVFRGGGWYPGSYAGVFYLSGDNSRGGAGTNLGFRAAYIPEIR